MVRGSMALGDCVQFSGVSGGGVYTCILKVHILQVPQGRDLAETLAPGVEGLNLPS